MARVGNIVVSVYPQEQYNPVSLDTGTIIGYANSQINATHDYIRQLGLAVADLTPPAIEAEFPTVDAAPVPVTSLPPEMQQVVWQMPGLPTEFSGTLNIDAYMPEPFDETPPELSYGAAPTAPTDTLPNAPQIDFTYDEPVLDLTLPETPELLSLNVSSFGGINIPTIDFEIPELNLVAPSIREYTPGEEYTSALLDTISAELLDRIQNGGTGLNPDVEQALWDRARERELRQKQDSIDELERMEAMGFAFPPGVYLDARQKLTREHDYNIANLSREIMIAQAELEQKNVQQALEAATVLERQNMEYANQVEQRLFEAARYATEAGISIYNAKVQAYAAYLDAYKAKVQIYEAQVRAEMTKVEAYKAEIDAELAKAQVNRALVDQYKTQVDAALANVEVFKAQILAIQSKADIEKLKVEIFGEQVRGYAAQINAYTASVEGYRAEIAAEESKQSAFTSQVQAYAAEVDAQTKAIEAKIGEYTAKIRAKELEWEGYKASADAESARARSIAANNESLAAAYRAEVSAISAYNDTLTKQWQAALDQAQRVSEIGVSAAKANAELYMTTRSLALDAAKVGAQVSAQLGAAALSAMNVSESYSVSNSYSGSESLSLSGSVSETYSYAESASI